MSFLRNEKKPLIYLITRGNLTDENYSTEFANTLEIIKAATEIKIPFIQIREKRLSPKLVLELTGQALAATRNTITKILVNERTDIAAAVKADGVHLTANSIPVKTIRNFYPDGFIIGVSAHSLPAAEKAKREGADFVTVSPIFPPISKPFAGIPLGLEKLREICTCLDPFPAIALGGIDQTNYRKVFDYGAAGIAGISFLNEVGNLRQLSNELKNRS